MNRISFVLFAFTLPSICVAAEPDDRGPRGWFVSGGMGLSLGSAVDGEGRSAGGFTGSGGHFRFGEEVLPNFTLGIALLGTGGVGNNDRYEAGLGGLLLQTTYRPEALGEHLVFVLGTGLGGGALDAKGAEKDAEEPIDGAAGGALFQAGVLWEFAVTGGSFDGLRLAPAFNYYLTPATDSNEASIQAFSVGIETSWLFGR